MDIKSENMGDGKNTVHQKTGHGKPGHGGTVTQKTGHHK
jgi:hypothetical protein